MISLSFGISLTALQSILTGRVDAGRGFVASGRAAAGPGFTGPGRDGPDLVIARPGGAGRGRAGPQKIGPYGSLLFPQVLSEPSQQNQHMTTKTFTGSYAHSFIFTSSL